MRVFLLQFLEPPGLVSPQAAVLLTPAVIGLLGDPEPADDLGAHLPFGQGHLRLTQLVDDLLYRMPFLRHHLTSLLDPEAA